MQLVQCYLGHVIENNNNAKGTTNMRRQNRLTIPGETIFFGIYVNDLKLRSYPEAVRVLKATGRITWVGVEIVRLSSTKYTVNGAQVHGVPQAFREAAKLAASGAPLPVYGLAPDAELDAEFELIVGKTMRERLVGFGEALASKTERRDYVEGIVFFGPDLAE